jgi:hypothetical protein
MDHPGLDFATPLLLEDRHPSAAIFVERSYTSSSNGHSDMRSDNVEVHNNFTYTLYLFFLIIHAEDGNSYRKTCRPLNFIKKDDVA